MKNLNLIYLAAGVFIIYLMTREKQPKKVLPNPENAGPRMEGVNRARNYSI